MLKPYEPTTWVDQVQEVVVQGTPVNAKRMQKIEDAIAELSLAVIDLQKQLSDLKNK